MIAFLMRLRRINAFHIEISEKSPLFNLSSSSLCVFVPLWLNRAPEESQVKKPPIFRQNFPVTANAVF